MSQHMCSVTAPPEAGRPFTCSDAEWEGASLVGTRAGLFRHLGSTLETGPAGHVRGLSPTSREASICPVAEASQPETASENGRESEASRRREGKPVIPEC